MGIVVETNPEAEYMSRHKVKLITDKKGNKKEGETVDLTKKYSKKDEFKWTIVKTLDPHEYDVNVADYFIAQGI